MIHFLCFGRGLLREFGVEVGEKGERRALTGSQKKTIQRPAF